MDRLDIVITPDEIKDKALRIYPQFVKAWLADEQFFPKRLPVNLTLPNDLLEAKRSVETLRAAAKQHRGHGYAITWQSRRSRSHGLNEFPTAITFESDYDFLFTTGRANEFSELKSAVSNIRSQQPNLAPWLLESTHWKDVLKVAGHLNDLLLMTQYLVDNPRPDCFAREIPLPVSTKLIEENRKILAQWLDRLLPREQIDFRFDRDEFEARYGLRYVRHHVLLRCLDSDLQCRLGLRFNELSVPIDSISQLPIGNATVIVVENKVNLLTLPPVKNGLAIGGLGKAVSLLRDVTWMNKVPILYWGDLDVEGFEILSQFREMFPQTQSLFMDTTTLEKLSGLAIEWPNRPGPEPTALTDAEQAAYRQIRTNKLRLEQERIPQNEVERVFLEIGLI